MIRPWCVLTWGACAQRVNELLRSLWGGGKGVIELATVYMTIILGIKSAQNGMVIIRLHNKLYRTHHCIIIIYKPNSMIVHGACMQLRNRGKGRLIIHII